MAEHSFGKVILRTNVNILDQLLTYIVNRPCLKRLNIYDDRIGYRSHSMDISGKWSLVQNLLYTF